MLHNLNYDSFKIGVEQRKQIEDEGVELEKEKLVFSNLKPKFKETPDGDSSSEDSSSSSDSSESYSEESSSESESYSSDSDSSTPAEECEIGDGDDGECPSD